MRSRANPIAAFILFFSGTSVYFLALISMERALARPIRHRIANSRVYNCSIVIVWAVGLVVFGLTVLSFHYSDLVKEYVFLPFRTCLLISFLIICVSYLSIRTRLRAPPPAELDNHISIKGAQFTIFKNSSLGQLLHRLRFGCLLLLSTQGEYFVSEAFYTTGFWLLDACIW